MPTSTGTVSDSAGAALVVVGMKDELDIAAGPGVQVVAGAAKASLLRERIGAIDPSGIGVVYSFGVAGSLDPGLDAGELLIATGVVAQPAPDEAPGSRWVADEDLVTRLDEQTSRLDGIRVRRGLFLGSDLEARDNPSGSRLWQTTGAISIDNESHIAARFAHANQLPFAGIRAISDSVHRPLPPAALLPLDPRDGRPDLAAIAWSLLTRPVQLPALIRVARDYGRALGALKTFRQAVGFPSPGSRGLRTRAAHREGGRS